MSVPSDGNIGIVSEGLFAGIGGGGESEPGTGPPKGSRLVQYMQSGPRKNSGLSQPGQLANGVNPHALSWTPSTSQQTPFLATAAASPFPAAAMTSLSSAFTHHMSIADARLTHSSSSPVFPPENGFFHQNSFHSIAGVNSRDTPTPPGQQPRRKISKSPVIPGGVGLRDSSSPNVLQEAVGGTTYFYNSEDANFIPQPMQQPSTNSYSYQLPASYVAHFRPKGVGIASFFAPEELKMELVHRQMVAQAEVEAEQFPSVPQEVEAFHKLVPLRLAPDRPGFFLPHLSSVYKANSTKDGLAYCLYRLHNCRLLNTKCLGLVETWKKLVHCNVVQLGEVWTTKSFGDYSLVFVYDLHPGAETMKTRHFSGISRANSLTQALYEELEGRSGVRGGGGAPPVPESLLWSYVIQLSSALRAIHSQGLAARTLDPSKILIAGRSKVLVNCCGIMDVLTFEQAQMNLVGAIHHYQQEDLIGLGRLVMALSCKSLQAGTTRESLHSSINFISQHYSKDLSNLVTYLVSPLLSPNPGSRPRNINDIMPMIGARFYAQLEASQMRVDLLENELSKEIENGRLFRLLCKLGSLNERAEFHGDAAWSETGDRYLLKLFRDHLFHQISEDGTPWLDLAHVVQCLNKLDAGVPEKLTLVSRDEQNVLVVSYADLRNCVVSAFRELAERSAPGP